jgi:hypothetical protein
VLNDRLQKSRERSASPALVLGSLGRFNENYYYCSYGFGSGLYARFRQDQKAVAKPKATTCSAENMAKTHSGMQAMPYSPARMAMDKEMAAVSTAMSKGDMRAACARYANVQKMAGK